MRLSVIKEMDPDTIILCKRLIGYSETELRAINIKDNTHSGDWDMDLLADWTADLTVDLGLEKATNRDSFDYTVTAEVVTPVDNVGDIIVYDKQVNGFKVKYTGSAASVDLKLYVQGGNAA